MIIGTIDQYLGLKSRDIRLHSRQITFEIRFLYVIGVSKIL